MHLRSLPKIATAVAALLLATGCSSKNDSKGGATGKSSGGGLADVGSPDVGASEANAGPDATDGPDAGAAMDRFPDQAAGDAACASSGNSCNTLPAPECEGSVLKTYYDPNGACVAGVCQYRYTSQTCAQGCHAGQCDPSSCDGSPSCNVPSPCDGSPACDGLPPCDGSPSCHGGAPPCEGSTCNTGGDLCAQVHCDSLPANVCVGSDLHTYVGPQGTCTQGVCSYIYTTQTCANGCSNGACIVHVCTPGSATFSADVTNVDSLATVSPLPALAGGAGYEIRSYMTVKDSYIGVQVPIYAPTNMTIQASVHYYDPLHNPSDTNYQGEWGLTFEASCNTLVSFAHVRSVVQKIADVTASAADGGSATNLVMHPVDFAAGEILGHYVHDVGYLAWDFVVTDSSVTHTFGNQARYVDGQLKYLHAICPFDPYPPTQRQTYLSLLGTTVDPPVAGRLCGTAAHDRVGTVAGAWFHNPYAGQGAQQARDASGNPLSVFKAETGAVFVADLDGTGSTVGFLTFRIDTNNTTYRDPETITSTYCYERQSGATGWAYLNLVSDTQLQVAYSATGTCPASFPNANVETYYR